MERINYLESAAPGLYFFNVNFTPNKRVYTVLIKPESGIICEVSVYIEESEISSDSIIFNIAFGNKLKGEIKEVLKNIKHSNFNKHFAPFTILGTSENQDGLDQTIAFVNGTNFNVSQTHWEQLKTQFPELEISNTKEVAPAEFIAFLVEAMSSQTFETKVTFLGDFQGFCSFAAKNYLRRHFEKVSLNRIKYIDQIFANMIADTGIKVLRLNGISELGANEAIGIGKVSELYLDSLKSIDTECAKNLCSNSLTYISLKGVKSLSAEVLDVFKENEVFVSAKDLKNEGKILAYSQETIDNSIVSRSKEFSKLKKLLLNPDKGIVESGISILASYTDDPYLFDTLLEKVEIKNGIFNTKELGNGLKIEPALLNYIVTAVLFYAGPEARLAEQIKQNTQILDLEISNLSFIHCFTYLESLILQDPNGLITNLNELDATLGIKKLDISACNEIEDISKIANFPIESFRFKSISELKSFLPLKGKVDKGGTSEINIEDNDYLENLDGIEFYQSLEKVYLDDCNKIKNVRALGAIKSLKDVTSQFGCMNLSACSSDTELFICSGNTIDLEIDEWNNPKGIGSDKISYIRINCRGMLNLDWLEGFPNLYLLKITCASLVDISGIKFTPNLKVLELKNCGITELKGIENSNTLERIEISECNNLIDVKEFALLNMVQEININNCAGLESLEGLTKNSNIAGKKFALSINNLPALTRLGDLSNFTQLNKVEFRNVLNSAALNDLTTCKNLIEVHFKDCNIYLTHGGDWNYKFVFKGCNNFNFNKSKIKEIQLINSAFVDLTCFSSLEDLHSLTLEENEALESLEGLKNLGNLKTVKLIKNRRLADISSLSKNPQLETIHLSILDALKDVSCLAKIDTLKTLDITHCEHLEVKPRPMGLIQDEKVYSYQIKLAEHYKLDVKKIKGKIEKIKADPEANALKKQGPKIKKLLLERDYESINLGLSILESLNEEALINLLLDGIEYNERKIKPNKTFTGTSPAQPFLDYALLGILRLAEKLPKWKAFIEKIDVLEIDTNKNINLNFLSKLKKLEINKTETTNIEFNFPLLEELRLYSWANRPLINLDLIKNCEKLEYLDVKSCCLSNGFNGIKDLTNLKTLYIGYIAENTITDLKELSKLTKLEFLKIEYNKVITSIEGIENCTELKNIELNELPFTDSKPLIKLNKLEEIRIGYSKLTRLELAPEVPFLKKIDLSNNPQLTSISGSIFPEEIISIELNKTNISSFPKLNGVKNISYKIDCSNCPQLLDLKGLNSIEKIRGERGDFSFGACPNLQDFNDIMQFNPNSLTLQTKSFRSDIPNNSIKKLHLTCIEDLEGIGQFPELEQLVVYGPKLSSLLPLKNLKKLTRLSISQNPCIESLDGIEHLSHLEILDLAKMENLKDIKALDNMLIDKLYIAKCFLKKADFQSHLQDKIDWQSEISTYNFFKDN